jgi:hypothetical protein
MVTSQQAAQFAAAWNIDDGESSEPCCVASHFRIDILGTPRSPWNRSAARVFCDDFLKEKDLTPTPDIMQDVMDSFYTRLKTLRRDYQLNLLHPPERLLSVCDA